MSEIEKRLKSHPHWPAVAAIYHKLQSRGYKAFLAGGCVRDALMGVEANDLDVATDANPGQIERLFEKTVNVGKSFGVIRVLIEGADIEVATFRTDGTYVDGRRPEGVKFATPEEDAQRRDFTVNALFFDLEKNQLLDFVGGEKDLKNRRLATVGDAERRFQEDHLRLLRAARFVAQLDFDLDVDTAKALQKMSSLVTSVSGERLRDEMTKLFKAKEVQKGLTVMVESGLMKHLFAFRAHNANWDSSLDFKRPWHSFSLFLRAASGEELKKAIKLLKFSNKEQKAIETSWQTFKKPEEFLALSPAKKLMKMSDEGVLWALRILVQENHPQKDLIALALQDWLDWGAELPKPFLTGDDVTGIQGRAIGQCLAKAYELQLERKLKTRDEALAWLKDFSQKDVHG